MFFVKIIPNYYKNIFLDPQNKETQAVWQINK